MNCRRTRRLINAFLDGELQEKDRQQLQAHLEKCPACREVIEDLKAIKSRLVRAGEIEPSDRVWEKLKSRLQDEVIPRLLEEKAGADKKTARKTSSWFGLPSPVFRYAAAALVFVAFVAGAFYLGRHYQKPGQPAVQVASQSPALQKIEEAEFYYQKAVQSLTEALESYNGGLSPELTEIVQANLNLLDRTIDLARQAVNEKPEDQQAHDFLISAYNSKMNFLNDMLETRKSLAGPGLEKL